MKNIGYFSNLDSLRFIAFLFVFISHLGEPFTFDSSHNFAFLNIIFQQGRNAVSFFFVLSGFLITYQLIKEKNKTSIIDIRSFYIKRICRILPLYFLICILGFFVIPTIFGDYPNESKLLHLFLGANFNQMDLYINGIKNSMVLAPLWSIAVEEQFYLFWPIILFLIKPKYYLFLFIGFLFSSYIFIYLNRFSYVTLMLHSFSVLPEFMIGATLSYLVYYKSELIHFFARLSKWWIIGVYVASFVFFYFSDSIHRYLFFPFFCAFIIFEQVFATNSVFKVSRIRSLDFLGKISYGSYMYHSIVLLVIKYFFDVFGLFESHSLFNKTICIVVCMGLTIAISYLSFNTFEKYFLDLRKKLLKQ